MITIRKSNERGTFNHGWLDASHTFSFGNYYDPKHMRFRALRVMNEDRVSAKSGFGTHPHENMEIITYVISGELEHKDSMGNGSVIKEGEFQVITAGTGITHSEFNPATDKETHLYQMWIMPDTKNLRPAYGQKRFHTSNDKNNLELVACKNPSQGELKVNQDVKLFLGHLTKGERIDLPLTIDRYGWLQVVKGSLSVNGIELTAGDGASIKNTVCPELIAISDAEILFFDLA